MSGMGKYGDAAGYDRYMGGWSAALSPLFLDYVGDGLSDVLDVGCGTGNLLVAVREAYPNATLTGVDPSEALLATARARVRLSGAKLIFGTVESLPFADEAFSHTLSMLVLQEFAGNAGVALEEMRRVTRAGGMVAGCQWDFARMPVIAALVDAITTVDAALGAQLDGRRHPVFAEETELADAWTRAGLVDVHVGRITVRRSFPRFDVLWNSLLAGSTPSTMTLADMSPAQQHLVNALMVRRLATNGPDRPLTIDADALVVRGARRLPT